jgi:hypothetical protein
VTHLKAALDFHRSQNAPAAVTRTLVRQLIAAMLRARQYTAVTALAEDMIGKSRAEDVKEYYALFGNAIKNELERLLNAAEKSSGAAELDNARALVEATLKMEPALDAFVVQDVQRLGTRQEQLRSRRAPAPAVGNTPRSTSPARARSPPAHPPRMRLAAAAPHRPPGARRAPWPTSTPTD